MKPIKPLAAATLTTAALVLAGCGAGGTTNTSPATGDDPVFAAIDAALAQYPGGVTVSDAISQALDQHPGSTVDDAELDDDDDRATLEWQIDLDDENRRDLAEVRIPAN